MTDKSGTLSFIRRKHKQPAQERQSGHKDHNEMRGRGRLRRLTALASASGLTLSLLVSVINPGAVFAAACAAPTTDLGTVSLSVAIPADATYTVWTRMIAPDATNNSINLEIDGNDCYSVGGGSFAQTTFDNTSANWVNYANGTPSTPLTKVLNAGNHTFKYIGTKAGVGVDRIIVSSDTACTPLGTGDNCQSGDSTPPTVNLIQPTANQNIVGTTDFSATATDASGIQDVKFLVDGQTVGSDATSPYSFSWNSASVSNGTHTVAVQATDTKGNSATSAPAIVTTNNATTCSGTPSVPANLSVTGTTASSVSLSWDPSTPASSCTIKEYRIYRDGTQVTSVASGTSFDDTGLTPGQTFSYTVTAVDTSGHESAQSTPVTGSTSGDNQAPTTPTNVHTTLIGTTNIALAWDASTDNTAVTSYVVQRNGADVGTSPNAAFTDSGLTPNTTYSYTVKAKDAAGNLSAASTALSAKTKDGSATSNSLYIDPAGGNYTVGSNITVSIRENSNSDPVNAVQADLNYSASNLEFVSIDGGTSDFGVDAAKSGGSGTVSIARGNTSALTGDKLVAKVTFKVTGTGNGTIEVATSSAVLSSVTNDNVASQLLGAAYTLGNTPTTPPPTTPPPTTPPPTTPPPTTPPPTTPPPARPPATPPPVRPATPPATSKPSTTTTTTKPATTTTSTTSATTIAPQGNSNPLPLTSGSEVELTDPAVIQTTTTTASSVKKVEYLLNGKLVATVTQPPFSYSVKTNNLRNGKYTLTTKTYYSNGKIETSNSSITVKNPLNFTQLMLQLRHYAWVLLLLALIAGGAIWFLFFKRGPVDEFGDPGMFDDPNVGGGFDASGFDGGAGGDPNGMPPMGGDQFTPGGPPPPAAPGGDTFGRY